MAQFRRMSRFQLTFSLVLACAVTGLAPAPALARKSLCSGRRIFLEDVSVRQRAGINSEEIHDDFVPALEEALTKKGFQLVATSASGAADAVDMKVRVRAWMSKTGSGRRVLELAASVRVARDQVDLWDGDVNPGNLSRLLHSKNSTPANLASRTADLVEDACLSDWTLEE